MKPKVQPIEFINEQIDYWLQRQDEALRAVDYAERQLDRLIGMKTLRLVGAEPQPTVFDPEPPEVA